MLDSKKLQIDILTENKIWSKKLPDYKKIVRKITKRILEKVDFPLSADYIELSVMFVDDKYIRNINCKFRNIDKATNVLSFPNIKIFPPKFDDIIISFGVLILGDVMLALETIEKEAIINKVSFSDHVHHLVIHGILHLLGYDHEKNKDADIMENLEAEILADFNISSPYANF